MIATLRKVRCYLDTSIFNFLLADHIPDKQRATQELLAEIKEGRLEAFISDLVLQELGATPDEEKRVRLLEGVQILQPINLRLDAVSEALADHYIRAELVPQKYRNDALHIAIATVNDLDVVISWNLDHMVKLKTRVGVNATNRLLGYKELEIATPEEVIER